MKWYSSFDYRPEADSMILIKRNDIHYIPGNQLETELISARLGFYTYLESHPETELIWQYATGFKDCEPIKVSRWS